MAALGDRIRQALVEKGLSQAELARLVGVKQQTISYLCAHSSPAETSRYASKIAQILGVNPRWLASGEGDRHDPTVRIEVNGVEITARQVPLLGREQVVSFLTAKRRTKVKCAMLMTDADVGDAGFAFEIDDESMAPNFRPGDRVLFDGRATPHPGDFVAAAVDSSLLFRKYRARGATDFELVPMNTDWPTASSRSAKILGVMVEHRTYRRR